ncbi:MAG: bile acid:sodium symporter [Candidatus Lokiarchaeota archaeon]
MTKKVQKFSAFLTKYLPLLFIIDVTLSLTIGILFPTLLHALKSTVTFALFFVLFPMMMGIAIKEVKRVGRNGRILAVSMGLNFIVAPIIAYLWAKLFFTGLDPLFIAGWILKITVPASSMMVAWTGIAHGKIETALLIQVLSFLIAIIMIPIWMTLLVGAYVPVNFLYFTEQILIIIVVPMIVGLFVKTLIVKKRNKKYFNTEIKPFLPPLSTLGMYYVIFVAIGQQASIIITHLDLIGILIASICVVYPGLFVLSLYISKKAGLQYKDAIAIGFGTTAKNHGITLVLAITTFGGLAVLPPSLVPIFQVILMIIITKLSPKIEKYINTKKNKEKRNSSSREIISEHITEKQK